MEGFIMLHRKMTDWEWYDKSEMVHLFIHILLKANHKTKQWRGVEVKRGQLLTGLNALNKETNLSKQTLRTSLKRLEKTGEINRQSNNQYTIITVCNYDSYNSMNGKTNNQTNTQLTSEQQATNKQVTTTNNVNKDNNVNNDKETIHEIVNYLNNKTDKNFKSSSDKTKKLIKARMNEGFDVNDFKKVINIKVKKWKDDDKMKDYLRPETLFSNKFESYLNEEINESKPGFRLAL